MFCKYCGKVVADNAMFCGNCGQPVSRQVINPVPVPAPQEGWNPAPQQEIPVANPQQPAINPQPEQQEAPQAFGETVMLQPEDNIQPETASVPPVSEPIPAPVSEQPSVSPEPPVPPVMPAYEAPQYGGVPQEPAEPVKKKKKWWIWLIVAAAVVILGVGAAVFLIFNNIKKNYEEAQELYAQGQYAEAAEAFDKLGTYSNSAELAERARLWTDAKEAEESAGKDPDKWEKAAQAYSLIPEEADAASASDTCHRTSLYYQACRAFDNAGGNADEVTKAKGLFESCGGIEDSSARIAECDNELKYIEATGLLEAENWAEAEPVFAELAASGYKDADEMSELCQDEQAYAQGKALMAEKKWADAEVIFDPLADKDFKDSLDLWIECDDWMIYEEAEALFAEGHFYDAYKKFDEIYGDSYEGMPDIYSRMEACIQPLPASGEVYHNPAYSNNTVELTIDNAGFKNSFVKLYIGGELISSIFIAEEGSATVMLPAGTYTMNKGYGDVWFGTEDLFGDEGRYWKCTFGDSETFTLEAYNGYLISAGGEGTSIYDDATDRDSM